MLENINGVRVVEVQESISRNRVEENVTVFKNEDLSINTLKERIDAFLEIYFEEVSR